MHNLIRMDLYRMRKARSFRVCLILAFVFSLASTPLARLLYLLGKALSPKDVLPFPEKAGLCSMIASPASALAVMLALLSTVSFFHADMENGYIKNIAGQMPRKGYSILSRYLASVPHNLLFFVTGLAGNLIGTLLFQKITVEGSVPESLAVFLLKLLLMQGLCAILLLVTATFRNKSLGMILAVVLGLPLMTLIYLGINAGLQQLLGDGFDLTLYMPDQLLKEDRPDTLRSVLAGAVTIGVFLPLAVKVFDKRDIK